MHAHFVPQKQWHIYRLQMRTYHALSTPRGCLVHFINDEDVSINAIERTKWFLNENNNHG